MCRDLCTLAIFSTGLKCSCESDILWKELVAQDFPEPEKTKELCKAEEENAGAEASWKGFYRKRYKKVRAKKTAAHRRQVLKMISSLNALRKEVRSITKRLAHEGETLLASQREQRRLDRSRRSSVALWQPQAVSTRHQQVVEQAPVDAEARLNALANDVRESKLRIQCFETAVRTKTFTIDLRLADLESLLYTPLGREDLGVFNEKTTELYKRGTGFHDSRCSLTTWSTMSSWRSLHWDRRGTEQWKNGDVLRMLSTKPTAEEVSGRKNSVEKEASPEQEAMARPQTIDDFKHEEIEGPTVERDMSDTANQLRSSQSELTTAMANLQTGFVTLGCIQLLANIWGSISHDVGLIQGLSQDLAFMVSFFLAYLLRYYVSAIRFFRRVEERGRMKILTLSLQVTKMLLKFFERSSFMVKGIAAASLCVLLFNIWRSSLGL